MLLDDIIELATNTGQSITVLLRKCVVLAHQIKNDRLKTWANMELSGYGDEDELPNYRVVSATAMGHFSGWGGSQATLPIPPAALEKNHQRFASQVHLAQAIATYEDLVKTATTDGQITMHWPPNMVLYYQNRIPFTGQQMSLLVAYQEIPKPTLVELLDTVRNRVLNVALEIQSELGERDEDLKHITPQSEEKIERYVAQQIFNGNVYVSTGQSTMTFQEQHIAAGNWEELQKVLCNSGISQSELKSLSTAVSEDANQMGPTVKGWIEKTAPKVLSGGVKMAASVGQAILTEYLKHYFGLN
jgi:hypothetical protein